MTEKQGRIIKVYKALTEVRTVHPSYRVVAKAAKVSVGTAYEVIQAYKKQEAIFGLKEKI
jgi:hypothetical protein